MQYRWHQRTGYLPLGTKGIYSFPNEVNYPILALAQADLGKQRDDQVRLHIGPQNQIRTINDEALEAIFAGLKTPQQAMNEAVKRANYALLRFARNTGKE